jgi:polyribonucleotide nucleotidyltransferase
MLRVVSLARHTRHRFPPPKSVQWSICFFSSESQGDNDGNNGNNNDGNDDGNNESDINKLYIQRIVDGKPVRFGTGSIANLAKASVVGTAGHSLVLSVVATDSSQQEQQEPSSASSLADALRQTSAENIGFTVSYQERYHGVGKIPTINRMRRDTINISDDEILAGRAVDRALRPLLKKSNNPPLNTQQQAQQQQQPQAVHVSCSVQAHDGRGNPVALALNAASVALGNLLETRVAAVHLCLTDDGTVISDPTFVETQDAAACLLYAGTRDSVVMMEASSPTRSIPEDILIQLIELAHGAIQPILDTQELLVVEQEEQASDDELLASLGVSFSRSGISETAENFQNDASALLYDAYMYCQSRLGHAALRLFGYQEGMNESTSETNVKIHPIEIPLLPKSIRGRREHLLSQEIERLLMEGFVPSDYKIREVYQGSRDRIVPPLSNAVHKKMLQNALYLTASKYQTRGDNRTGNGTRTIRPLAVAVPALPDSVHGSSLFSRGETQVLCTSTLGAPRDGVPLTNPYHERNVSAREPGPFDDLPVGSLRYLRSQEAMISDFNSKKVKAAKEMTGDSGTLDEVRRFFLQYDFPSFSKGDVPSGRGNRREVGHGRLAEKAIDSVIPHPSDFPYSMRVTSEVTSSNGSSSMATVCGATLALLDAGIPLRAPVAGVSVGLALGETVSEYCLLLDITGTEDHYGWMDFKIAGTTDGVTALQLDVKTPLSMKIVSEALHLAREGRVVILEEMETLSRTSSAGIISKLLPRPALKDSAPRVEVVRFDPLRKKDLVGPGGAVLRQLEDRFDITLDLTQEGQCLLFGHDRQMVADAKAAVMDLVADVEEGQIYTGTIIEIKDFGAVVELLRNKEGLLHVSEITEEMAHPEGNFGVVHRHLTVGQKIEVLCTGVDPVQGYIRLSRKALLQMKVDEAEKRLH